MDTCDFGLIGLAVMGQNLVLNVESRNFSVAVHNRTTSVTDEFLAGAAAGKQIKPCDTVEELCASLKTPRKVMIMVKAGKPVDMVIDSLLPHLDKGDVIIDGGNSEYTDSERRAEDLAAKGILFVGTGVSGGEEGALKGPSIMPGGNPDAWPLVQPILQAIAAKVGPNHDIPCCEWIGPGGSGHYVKMVHNGIEYGDMQLICEAYDLLHRGMGLDNDRLHEVFKEWDTGVLDSYLIEITKDIFTVDDPKSGGRLVDSILDTAGQKGTGRFMSQLALDLGVPTTLITEAVFARCLSAQKQERVRASKVLEGPDAGPERFRKLLAEPGWIYNGRSEGEIVDLVKQALYASKIVSYAQGFVQLRAAAAENGWELNYSGIALMWRGGCIIRAAFLEDIKDAFEKNHDLENLLLDDYFHDAVQDAQDAWRAVVAAAVTAGIPVPAFSSALAYYDGYRSERLPANLLQAQRDYFGAHTYKRLDDPAGADAHHTDWLRERKT